MTLFKKYAYRTALIASVAINILLVGLFVGKRIYYSRSAGKQAETFETIWNALRVHTYEKLPVDSNDIVFIGNSLTEFFPLNEFFSYPHLKNRGISGNRIPDLIARIDPILQGHPRKLFIEIGENDLGNGVPPYLVFLRYKELLTIIQAKSPQTTIFVQSLLPVNQYGRYWKAQSLIEAFNVQLQWYCKHQHITYIEVGADLHKNGCLDPAYSFDGIHLNARGYGIWVEAIEKFVKN